MKLFDGTNNENACNGGTAHVLIFAGDLPGGDFPDGYLCACGKTRITYETCPCCGHKKMVMREVQ